MALSWNLINPWTIHIEDIDLGIAEKAEWMIEIVALATNIQAQMALNFATMSVAGVPLLPNTTKYNLWKVRKGKDPRRGHKDNVLQYMIDVKRYYSISFTGSSAMIQWHEEWLRQDVRHAKWYARMKVTNGARILQIEASEAASHIGALQNYENIARERALINRTLNFVGFGRGVVGLRNRAKDAIKMSRIRGMRKAREARLAREAADRSRPTPQKNRTILPNRTVRDFDRDRERRTVEPSRRDSDKDRRMPIERKRWEKKVDDVKPTDRDVVIPSISERNLRRQKLADQLREEKADAGLVIPSIADRNERRRLLREQLEVEKLLPTTNTKRWQDIINHILGEDPRASNLNKILGDIASQQKNIAKSRRKLLE